MKARELMTSNPEVVTPDEPVFRAAQLMRDLDVGIIPVVEDRDRMRLRGVITDRDIAVRHVAENHPEQCTVGDHMTHDRLDTVRPDSDVDEVFRSMKEDKVRRIPVVEDDGRLVGLIAQADFAVRRGRHDLGKFQEVLESISEPAKPRR